MGRWFPDQRKGSREQVQAHDRAQRELNEYGKRARKAGVREETPEFRQLNRRVNEAAGPLSRFQQSRIARDERIAAAERRERRAARVKFEEANRPAWSRVPRWPTDADGHMRRPDRQERRQQRKAERGRGAR